MATNGEDGEKPKSKPRVQPDPRLTETIALGEDFKNKKNVKKLKKE